MDRSTINKIIMAVVLLFAFVVVPIFYQVSDGSVSNDHFIGTAWSLLPAVIAIVLALITKEVYSSLFVGILVGAVYLAGFEFSNIVNILINDGMIAELGSEEVSLGFLTSPDIGIVMFLVILGVFVALMSRSGASASFATWASKHVKSRVGSQIATFILGILIFVDDYFNCLTVGSVMRPLTDRYKVSRAKLAYLIDSTAAPICIIAPISSWAAAVVNLVANSAYEGKGFEIFCDAIFYNYYAILTIIMVVLVIILNLNFGAMKTSEERAQTLGILTSKVEEDEEIQVVTKENGIIFDLIVPIVALIASCIVFLLFTGGFFDGVGFIDAFSGCSPSTGLSMGSLFALCITIVYFMARKLLTFDECMKAVPSGFKAMVPAILILVFAWTLKSMTTALSVDTFVNDIVGDADYLMKFLPAVFFLLAAFIAFCTGTSWGTFGVLIPIAVGVFNNDYDLMLISTSACMAGAVWGDHISPVSDTTIMSSAGAQCDLVEHVSTQLPYTLVVGLVSFVSYIIAGFVQNKIICLLLAFVILGAAIFVIKKIEESRSVSVGAA